MKERNECAEPSDCEEFEKQRYEPDDETMNHALPYIEGMQWKRGEHESPLPVLSLHRKMPALPGEVTETRDLIA